MIESLEAERLTLRVRPEVRLEAVGVDDGDVGLDGVERGTGLGNVLRDVPSSTCEDLVDRRDAVLRCLDFDVVDGLREGSQRRSEGEGGRRRTSCRRGVAMRKEE